ncbi:MAG: hypothetical protein CSA09_02525 [Candidatus Contendobacter odensis]|uniref:Transposase n=1 Tax=Candidatus Contendibacter odensensis TaxID=1400860 RepID=A0A2G6PFM3_9GAMM|nr:MAG: hypothetical protein CSA09_02525 [Candidatus Contendobacter odensis]
MDNRLFINAVLWLRIGAPWRDLPLDGGLEN